MIKTDKGKLFHGNTYVADVSLNNEDVIDISYHHKTAKSRMGVATDVYNTRRKLPIQLTPTKFLVLPKICHKTLSCSALFHTNDRLSKQFRDKLLTQLYKYGLPDVGKSMLSKTQVLLEDQYNIDTVICDFEMKGTKVIDYHLVNTNGITDDSIKTVLDFFIKNYSPVTLRSLPREVLEIININNTDINLADFSNRSLFVTMTNSYYGGFIMKELRNHLDLIIPISVFMLRVNKKKVS
jgi:hypothetical protein